MLLRVIPKMQLMHLLADGKIIKSYQISTAKNGLGERRNSEQTPRGWHVVAEKIGAGQPINAVFVSRQATGEIYSPELFKHQPNRDWILSRILWLAGLEPGKNLHGEVDTKSRYIYIHGVPDEVSLGVAQSRGCIRMRNAEIIELFDLIPVLTKVYVEEDEYELHANMALGHQVAGGLLLPFLPPLGDSGDAGEE